MITAYITLAGDRYAIKACTAAAVYFEQVTGRPFALETLTDKMLYCWSMVLASNPDKPVLDFRDFMDGMDESPDAAAGFEKVLDDLKRRSQAADGAADSEGDKKKD